jgi:hypothetical protein
MEDASMTRPRIVLAIGLFLLAPLAAFAGDGSCNNNYGNNDSWWQNFKTDWHRNDAWMCPFASPDRSSVWNILDAEVAKGWEAQDVLGEAHFEANNTELSPAGRLKMHTILTQNPTPFRTVFVAPGWSEEVTSKRLSTTQFAAAQMAQQNNAQMPPVLVSNMQPVSSSADYVAGVNTWFNGYMTSMPKPQPEAFQSTDSGSGSSSGGSQ